VSFAILLAKLLQKFDICKLFGKNHSDFFLFAVNSICQRSFASLLSPEAGLSYLFFLFFALALSALCFSTMPCTIKKQILNLRDQEFVE